MAIDRTSSREHRHAASRLDRHPRADRGRETHVTHGREAHESRETRSADSADRAPRGRDPERGRETRSADSAERNERSGRAHENRSADSAERVEANREAGQDHRSPDAADRYTPSSESREHEPPTNLQTFDRYFAVYDNPGGGDTDGRVSAGDIADVASGDYDREAAERRLRDQGVSADDIDTTLDRIEATARHYDRNEDEFAALDGANADGDTDGKISRGDVDRRVLDTQEQAPFTEASDAERAEAGRILRGWDSPADVTRQLDRRPDLADYSQPELLALAQAGHDSPEIAAQLREHVLDTVNAADSLRDLPRGEGFQRLLDPIVTADAEHDEDAANAQEHLRGLIDHSLESALDRRLRDHSGDSEADLGLERWGSDVENLVRTHPALTPLISDQADQVYADAGGQISDVRRNDDGIVRQAYHAGGDAVRSVYGGVADGIRGFGDLYGRFQSAGGRILGETADWAITSYGQVAGAGLDAVGADGVADGVRDVARSAGNGVNSASNWAARQTENFWDGFYGAPAGLVDGLGQISTNPVGVVRGAAGTVAHPSHLLEPYQERRNENGWAGVAGGLTFDLVATVATGGTSPFASGLTAGERALAAAEVIVPTDPVSGSIYTAGNADHFVDVAGR